MKLPKYLHQIFPIDQKGIVHFLPLLLMLVGIGLTVYLLKDTTFFKPKASGEVIVFKDANGNLLPTKDGIAQSESTTVNIEFTSPLTSKTSEPSLTPTPQQSPQRVFVTSTSYTANLGGLSGADIKCQERASAANLGGTWKAWLSDSKTSASSRLTHSNTPYKLINNAVVAKDWNDLTDGTLQSRIYINEFGKPVSSGVATWVGTQRNGNTMDTQDTANCNNWSAETKGALATGGLVSQAGYRWTENWRYACPVKNSLYCFEQSSTTPAPTTSQPFECTACTADVNGDGNVNITDFSVIKFCYFKKATGNCVAADINKDGTINAKDYSCLLGQMGKQCKVTSSEVLYRYAETPTELDAAEFIPYTKTPMSVIYKFKDAAAGTKFIWTEFKDSTGKVDRRSAQLEIISIANPSPTPTPTKSKTLDINLLPTGSLKNATGTVRVIAQATQPFFITTMLSGSVGGLKSNTEYTLYICRPSSNGACRSEGTITTSQIGSASFKDQGNGVDYTDEDTSIEFKVAHDKDCPVWQNACLSGKADLQFTLPNYVERDYKITLGNPITTVVCKSADYDKFDSPCEIKRFFTASNRTNDLLYRTTVTSQSLNSKMLTFYGFDTNITSGPSTTIRTVEPGQMVINSSLTVRAPSSKPGVYYATLIIYGESCNNKTTPPDCQRGSSSQMVFKIVINKEVVASPSPTPTTTATPTLTPTLLPTTNPQSTLPDLIVTNINIPEMKIGTWNNTLQPFLGYTKVTVKNQGNKLAYGYQAGVGLTIKGPQGQSTFCSGNKLSTSGIAPGASEIVELNCISYSAGVNTFTAEADDGNNINESNENNNTYSTNHYVQP